MNADATYQHSLSISSLNIDTPISIVGITYLKNIPKVVNGAIISNNSLNYSEGIAFDNSYICWTVGNQITDRPGILKVTIQYTKTTD